MVTGTDELSLHILQRLKLKDIKVKDIPAEFGISLDQAKRLSRLSNILIASEENLTVDSFHKIQKLGIKALWLNELFKAKDYDGLDEILSSVDENTTRDLLKKLIASLEAKRERVREFQEDVSYEINRIEREKQSAEIRLDRVNKLKQTLETSVEEFNVYPVEIRNFLLEHVGVNNNEIGFGNEVGLKDGKRFVLIKRLDSLFKKKLTNNGCLYYDKWKYVNIIVDLDKFAKEVEQRMKKGWNLKWDYETEHKRSKGRYWVTDDPYYTNKNNTSLVNNNIMDEIKTLEEEVLKTEKEIKKAERRIKKLRKEKVSSFLEAAEASNTLSAREIARHAKVQTKIGRWLFSRGYTRVCFELVLPDNRRADVIGVNEEGKIVIVEVKVSKNDFKQDKKWGEYIKYCDEFYFGSDERLDIHASDEYEKRIDEEGAGFLYVDGRRVEVWEEDRMVHKDVVDREKNIKNIGVALTKKILYGY